MRKSIASFSIAIIAFFALFSFGSAQTSLQAELDALLAQLAALQAQLAALTGGGSTPTPPPTTGSGQCPNLYRSLRQGMSGTDVTALQRFLAADSRLYPDGTISGYFGPLTQAAVQALQRRHNLVTSGTPDTTGYGSVGPATRNLIATLCTTGGVPTNPGTPGGHCFAGDLLVENGKTGNFYSVQYVQTGQNCSSYLQTRQCINGTLSGSSEYRYGHCGVGPSSVPGSCSFNGVTLMNGETRTFYRTDIVPFGQQCQGVSRTCTNGILSGTSEYAHPSCVTPNAPISCTLNGVTIAHGQSRTFYNRENVLFGQNCSSFGATRTCDNGTLLGDTDYRYASCTAAGAQSCTLVTTSGTTTSTTTVAHGASRSFWSEYSVPYTTTCDAHRLTRTCNDGTLSGSSAYKHPSCTTIAEKGCDIDGITVAGGAKRTFYTSRTAPSEGGCAAIDQERTCSNGVLSGNANYRYAYCAPNGQKYCVQDSAYVAHNTNKTFYSTKNPSFGSTCSQFAQTRNCTNGTLDGSNTYQYASCTEPTGASCVLDGTTVAHNQTYTFYSRSSAPSGTTCAQYGQARTCIDGILSGSASFDRSSCSNPTASTQSTSQLAAALAAMEALLHDALAKLQSWF